MSDADEIAQRIFDMVAEKSKKKTRKPRGPITDPDKKAKLLENLKKGRETSMKNRQAKAKAKKVQTPKPEPEPKPEPKPEPEPEPVQMLEPKIYKQLDKIEKASLEPIDTPTAKESNVNINSDINELLSFMRELKEERKSKKMVVKPVEKPIEKPVEKPMEVPHQPEAEVVYSVYDNSYHNLFDRYNNYTF